MPYIVWPITGNTNTDPGVTLFAVRSPEGVQGAVPTAAQLGAITQTIHDALNTPTTKGSDKMPITHRTFDTLKAGFPNYLTDDDRGLSVAELLYCVATRQANDLDHVNKAMAMLPDSVAEAILSAPRPTDEEE